MLPQSVAQARSASLYIGEESQSPMQDSSALWATFWRSLLPELASTHVEDLPGAQTCTLLYPSLRCFTLSGPL